MTIAAASPLRLSAKPVLDENRRLCPERTLQTAVRDMEATLNLIEQQATKKASSSQSSVPSSLRLAGDGGPALAPTSHLAFVYGTLMRGFGNHWLMEELLAGSHARFVGYACTKRRFPLVCGPFQVPFLLPSLSPLGHQVRGELYQVDSLALSRLDELEGVSKGHYERRPIFVRVISSIVDGDGQPRPGSAEMDMAASENVPGDINQAKLDGRDSKSLYTLAGPLSSCRMYMDPPKLDEMDALSSPPENSGYLRAEAYFACADYGLRMAECAPHIPCYTKKEASTYVRRKDRPHNRTFLEHVHAWIEKQGLVST